MEILKSKVYIQIDNKNRILRCEGGYTMQNMQNVDEWVFIDEGIGDKYNLCQNHYFADGLYTFDGIPRYKWDGERAVLRSDYEIESDKTNISEPEFTQDELQWQAITDLEISQMEYNQALTDLEIKYLEGGINI
jgi:hypothetical protein